MANPRREEPDKALRGSVHVPSVIAVFRESGARDEAPRLRLEAVLRIVRRGRQADVCPRGARA